MIREMVCRFSNDFLGCDDVLEETLSQMKTEIKTLTKQADDLSNEKDDYFESWKISREKLEKTREELTALKVENEELIKALVPEESEAEKYWNNHYPKKEIFYAGRSFPINPSKRFEIDVRHFFTLTQPLIELAVKEKLNSGSFDARALKCLKWVKANFAYASDESVFGSSEYWSFAAEALYSKKGDCDSGAILLACLMLASGIPYWRIRLNAGAVKGGNHAYLTYCRETDNEFVVLDWCYWYNSKAIADRLLHKDESDYYGIWFSWNQKYSFGAMNTMAGMPNDFKAEK